MKKLLQVNSLINVGSTGRIAEGVGKLAISRGWKSYIAYGRDERPSSSVPVRIGGKKDFYLHVLRSRLLDQHGFGSTKATSKLIKKIKVINPDVILLHNIHGYYLNVELLFRFLKQYKKPVFWTLYDCWPFTGHCSYFEIVACDRWINQCYQCPLQKEYPSSWFVDNSRENYQLKKEIFTDVEGLSIIVHSQWLGNLVGQSFLKNYPVHVINNGIDLEAFNPKSDSSIIEKYRLKDKFIILGVAHIWSPRKGLSDFIKLQKLLSENEKIILIGLNKRQIRELPKEILGLEKTESVEILKKFYSAADVFVNPTWEDNFPTTNIEALACGTPVITYNTGGSPEAIDEKTGAVIPKGDIEAMMRMIYLVKKNGKSSYGDHCLARAKLLFNNLDRYADFLKLFEISSEGHH